MTDDKDREHGVTDADIESIIAAGEAGIGDLMAAYEPVERHYFAALQSAAPPIVYAANTTAPHKIAPPTAS